MNGQGIWGMNGIEISQGPKAKGKKDSKEDDGNTDDDDQGGIL